jgi:uncharacterized protein YkwD
MTASQVPVPGTTTSRLPRFAAGLLAAVALILLCLPAAAAAAAGERSSGARGALLDTTAVAATPAPAPVRAPDVRQRFTPSARTALRGCAAARGLLRARQSVLRTRRRLLCLMNRARARFGLPPLRANRCLHRVASRHAHDMVRRRYFGHVTPNGWSPGQRARASGYVPRSAPWVVGENIAWGVAAAARPSWVVRAWLRSPSHRHNILSRRFRDAGVGVARGTPFAGFGGWRLRATFSVEFGAHGGRTRCSRGGQRVRRRARRSAAPARAQSSARAHPRRDARAARSPRHR